MPEKEMPSDFILPKTRKQKLLAKAEALMKNKPENFRVGKYKKLTTKQLTGFIGELKKAGLKK